jgi:hypothetical protein
MLRDAAEFAVFGSMVGSLSLWRWPMVNSKLSTSLLDVNRISANKDDKHLEELNELILPKTRFPFISTNNENVSPIRALHDVRSSLPDSRLRLIGKPKGTNKAWEVRCVFPQSEHFNIGSVMYFACHQNAQFTTYSIHFDGHELWFDQYDKALSLLNKEDVPNHIVDIASKYKPEPTV